MIVFDLATWVCNAFVLSLTFLCFSMGIFLLLLTYYWFKNRKHK